MPALISISRREKMVNRGLTSGSKNTDMNVTHEAEVDEIQCADNIASDRFLFVSLAPIDIWAAGHAGTVQHVGRLDLVELTTQSLPILHANGCRDDLFAVRDEHIVQHSSDPAIAADDQPFLFSHDFKHFG